MNIYVCLTHGNTPIPTPNYGLGTRITEADVVVLMHMNGTWSVWKDATMPRADLPKRVPWDLLPSHVKRAIPLYRRAA
jgi:hypothetical protein